MTWFTAADKPAFTAVSPLAVKALLIQLGWREQACPYTDAWFFVGDGEETPSFILPKATHFEDYPPRLAEIIGIIAPRLKIPANGLLQHLQSATEDVIRFRSHRGDHRGSIDVDGAINLYQGIRNILIATAYSALEPRPAYHFRRDVGQTASLFRFGIPEAGSHVATVTVAPQIAKADIRATADNGSFRPAEMLDAALSGLASAADLAMAQGDIAPFLDGWQSGISANLCQSLAELMEDTVGLTEINVRWSLTRPHPPTATNRRHALDRAWIPMLRDAATGLRESEIRNGETLVGYAIGVYRAEQSGPGEVTFTTQIEGRTRKVVFSVPEPVYGQFITAHSEGLEVTIQGDLSEQKGRFRLENVRLLTNTNTGVPA